MKAAVFEGPGKLTLTDRPKPSLTRADQVMLKVEGVGICGTDLHILQVPPAHPAKAGIIEGHEFTGRIEEVGTGVTGFEVGETVLVDPHPGCGVCEECRRGYPDHCTNLYATSGEPGHPDTLGLFSDGAMTSYVVAPQTSLYKVSPDVPPHIRALAEPLACVVNATNKLKVQPGEYVVILGAGPIGLLFTALMAANGASKIIVSEPSEYRRAAAGDVGADIVVSPEELESTVAATMGEGPDVVVEAVGPLLPTAVKLVRTGGRVMQFGHDESVTPQMPVGDLLKKEVILYGSFIGKYSYERVARIMESGKLPLERIVSHQMPLSKVHEAMDMLRAGKALKVVLHPED
ncbi:MAG: zinc-dependent alcohol dehydrogenase [Spirochaetaceae bacterium]